MYDVAIIGGGVVGCAIARELSRYRLRTCLLERAEDVCSGTSKANSAIVHAGYDAHPGSSKAKLNVKGNAMMDQVASELDIPFRRNGSFVVLTADNDPQILNTLYEQGQINGVPDLRILSGEEAHAIEPHLSPSVIGALYAPTGGIICPFELTMGFAENASANGVDFFLNCPVDRVAKEEDCFLLEGNAQKLRFDPAGSANPVIPCQPDSADFSQEADGSYRMRARVLVNAAGVYADVINNQLSSRKLHIIPRRGQYQLMDTCVGDYVDKTIFQAPSKMGKGVLVAPTIHGNLLLGPTAEDLEDKEGLNTTMDGLNGLAKTASRSVSDVPVWETITSFAGLRAHEEGGDFVLGQAEDVKGFYNAAGIESPGLTSAPAIGVLIAEQIASDLSLEANPDFVPTRKRVHDFKFDSLEERNAYIAQSPSYGQIICRCESISEGQIIDAIHRPLGARSLDAVKRRTRAGTGRCQSGFCAPKVLEILERELSLDPRCLSKHGPGSEIVFGENKNV